MWFSSKIKDEISGIASVSNSVPSSKISSSSSSAALTGNNLSSSASLKNSKLNSKSIIASSVQAYACSSMRVELHRIDSAGRIDADVLLASDIRSDGSFTLTGARSAGIDVNDPNIQYILRVAGCGRSFYRPLTGFLSQNVTFGSTLLAMSVESDNSSRRLLNQTTRQEVEELLAKLDQKQAPDMPTLLNQINSDSQLKSDYEAVTQIPPTQVAELPPQTVTLNSASSSLQETLANVFSAQVVHWNANYSPAYEWSIDNVVVSTSASYSYTPNKNAQGSHTVKVKVGVNNGSNLIDATKPTKEESFSFQVDNSFPAVAPALSLVSSVKTNSLTVNLSITTGALMNQCATFSSYAINESALVPPAASSFTGTCSTAGSQSETYTFAPGDGAKTLALWVKDSSGNISSASSSVSVILDQTAPALSLTSPTILKGGVAANITYSASDSPAGLQSVYLDYAADGVTFSQVADLTSLSSPYSWSVPSSNISTAKLRLRATDQAGNTTNTISSAFTIDSTAPVLTQTSFTSGNSTNTNTVTLGGACESGGTVNITGADGAQSTTCTSSTWTYTTQSKGSDQTYTYSISETDAAGNVGSSVSVSWVRDTVAPTMTQTMFTSGNSTNTSTVTFGGACQTGLTVNITGADGSQSSTCSASAWTYTTQSKGSDATYNYSFTQTDAAGNISSAVSVSWIKDSSAPSLTQTVFVSASSTNTNTINLGGACENGFTVNITGADGAQSATCTSSAWTYTTQSKSSDATYNYAISQTDSASNTTTVNVSWVRDTVAPVLTQTSFTNNTKTNTNTVTFGGACQTGVNVVVSGAESATATCSAGSWSFASNKTSDATYAYTFTQTDAATNSTSVSVNWIRDTVAPSLTQTTLANNTKTNTNTVNLGGACETGITVNITGADGSQSATCTSSAWTYTTQSKSSDATYAYTITQTDAATNSTSVSVNWIRDTVAPTVTQTALAMNTYHNTNTVTFGGACETGLTVNITGADGVQSTTCSASAWTYTTQSKASDATYNYSFTQTDAAGNTSSTVNANWIRDTVGPALTQTSVANNTNTNTNTVNFGGACETGVSVIVSGAESATRSCTAGAWSFASNKTSDGSYTYTFTQTDSAGNATSTSTTWVRDTVAPTLTQTAIANNTNTNTNTVTFGGACETGINVIVSGAESATRSCTASAWTFASNKTTDASYTYTFTQTDSAGNATSVSTTWVRDTVAPVTTITSPAANTAAPSQITLTGACETGLSITFAGSGILSSFSQACSGGSYSQTIYFSAGDGTKTISVSQTDAAGNTSAATSRNFVKDSVAPTITQTTLASPANTNTNTVTFGGACEAGLTIDITGAQTTTTTCSSGTWSFAAGTQSTDGSRTYNFTQTDAAGNTSTTSAVWVRDTSAPAFTFTSASSFSTSGNSVTFAGTCEGSLPITVAGAQSAAINCSGGAWSYSTSQSSDATYTYNFTETDLAGNTSSLTGSWLRSTAGPTLTITQSDPQKTNGGTLTISGSCSGGTAGSSGTINITGAVTTTATCSSTNSTVGTWSYNATQGTDGSYNYTFTITDNFGTPRSTSASITWKRDTTAPVLTASQFVVNSGTGTTSSRQVPVSLQAIDATTNVSHFCLKTTTGSAPSTPAANDTCWVAVNAPVPGLSLSTTLNLSNFMQALDFVDGTYTVYAWAKDEVGNISTLSSAGSGTTGQDKGSVTLTQGVPPTITSIFADRVDNTYPPLLASDEVTTAGNNVYIKWQVSDDMALPSNAIRIYFTTDDSTWTEINTSGGVANTTNGSCTVSAPYTGCYVWSSATNNFYRIRILVTDSTGKQALSQGNAMNTSPMRIIAGDPNTGLGGDGKNAVFLNDPNGSNAYNYLNGFVVTRNGDIYVRDHYKGILKISAATGLTTQFLKQTGTISGDGGAVSAATSRYVYLMVLDPQDRLWIWDYNVIRRIDLNLSTPTIQTIIGGGATTTDTVTNPLSLSMPPISNQADIGKTSLGLFTFSSNGVLYFVTDFPYGQNFANSTRRIRVYRGDLSTPRIESIYMGGVGFGDVSSENTTQNLSGCRVMNRGLSLKNTGEILFLYAGVGRDLNATLSGDCYGAFKPFSARFIYDSGTQSYVASSPHPPIIDSSTSNNIYYTPYTGRDGRLYFIASGGKFNRVYRYDYDPSFSTRGTMTLLAGNGNFGGCANGTLATSCSLNLNDMFVDEQSRIYLFDSNQVRMIKADGTIITVAGKSLSPPASTLAKSANYYGLFGMDLDLSVNPSKIIASDTITNRIFEITPQGNSVTIGGTGVQGFWSSTSLDANTQPYPTAFFGKLSATLFVHPTNGEIYSYLATTNYGIGKLNRSTNRWSFLAGNGATAIASADNTVGSNITYNSPSRYSTHPAVPIGFNGSNLLVQSYSYQSLTPPLFYDSYLSVSDVNNSFATSIFSGTRSANGNFTMCSPGTLTDNCELPYYFQTSNYYYSRSAYDPTTGSWIIGRASTTGLYKLKRGQNVSMITIPHSMLNFTYKRIDATTEHYYYCNASTKRIHKQVVTNETTLGANTTITWPLTSLNCAGSAMVFDDNRGVLVFIYESNGLMGIAETSDF